MRPIDAEKLEKDFTDWYNRAYPHDKELIEIAILSVRDAPTIEAEPVKHGHWIEHPDDIFPLESTIECSVCGEQENVNIHNDNYCSNCGAKMNLMAGDSE